MDFILQKRLYKIATVLSQASIVFYLMPALIILLVIGTLAQAEIGLYAAHQKYFSSFYFWIWFVPLPGGYTLLGVLTLNLLLKFLLFSKWNWRNCGIILSHFGALILLVGGLLTALSAKEGYMVIPEGAQSPFVYDYHARELQIYRNDNLILTLPFEVFSSKLGQEQNYQGVNFSMTSLNFCQNCEIKKRAEFEQDFVKDMSLQSFANFMALTPKDLEKEAEVNLSGFSFKISGAGSEQDGLYIAFEGMPKPIEVESGQDIYKIVFGKAQRKLPFDIRLIDFQKKDYPGMQMAREYSSDIVVVDGLSEWKSKIEMNAPLRYKGYTFYQSSFEQTPEREITILSVVENKGRIFPYLGTIILGIGLLLHLVIMTSRRRAYES